MVSNHLLSGCSIYRGGEVYLEAHTLRGEVFGVGSILMNSKGSEVVVEWYHHGSTMHVHP